MKKLFTIILAGAMALSLVACGSSSSSSSTVASSTSQASSEASSVADSSVVSTAAEGTVTIVGELGTTEVPVNPEKVVVFELGVLDILDSVGIEIGGLPQSTMPEYLSKFSSEDYLNAGGMKEVDFEAINEYGPDLIILSARTSDSFEEASAIAPTIYLPMASSDYLPTMRSNVEILAEIFPDKADELLAGMDDIEAKADALATEAEASGLTALLVMVNDDSISAFGPGSRYGVIYDALGFTAADADIEASTHGAEVNFEYIAEVNPDILFVIDRSAAIGTEGATGAAALLDTDLISNTTAAQEGRIVYLSSDVWYLATGGFTSTNLMIDEVATALA